MFKLIISTLTIFFVLNSFSYANADFISERSIISGCVSGWSYNGTRCVPNYSIGHGGDCVSKFNCRTFLQCKQKPNQVRPNPGSPTKYSCQCKDGTAWDGVDTCIPWDSQMFNESCTNSSNCFSTMICNQTNLVCGCKYGDVWTGLSCVNQNSLSIYQTCLTKNACDSSVGLTCISNYCQCENGYSWNSNSCVENHSGTFGDPCEIDLNCDTDNAYLGCNQDVGLCGCLSTQSWNSNTNQCCC